VKNVIIWLNGPFGIGKTQTAYELHERLPGSFVCDPEDIGFALFKTLPSARGQDFQDIPLWREFTIRTLQHVSRSFDGPVIVPMTLVVPEYHREIIGALRSDGFELRHFTLMASREVILRRLRGRADGPRSWGAQHLERCLNALRAPEFADHLETDGHGVEAVAEEIASRADLVLQPRLRDPVSRLIRRARVHWKHIRRA
jgi:AAA domain